LSHTNAKEIKKGTFPAKLNRMNMTDSLFQDSTQTVTLLLSTMSVYSVWRHTALRDLVFDHSSTQTKWRLGRLEEICGQDRRQLK
jgi:hypothetical protein